MADTILKLWEATKFLFLVNVDLVLVGLVVAQIMATIEMFFGGGEDG